MILQRCPEGSQLLLLIDVISRLTDPVEAPAAAFEIALPRKITSVGLRAMPDVAVAFDSESGLPSEHDEVNPIGLRRILRYHGVATAAQTVEDALFK